MSITESSGYAKAIAGGAVIGALGGAVGAAAGVGARAAVSAIRGSKITAYLPKALSKGKPSAAPSTDLVRYDPKLASRQIANQPLNPAGYATTPAGRTLSAHAADRAIHGAPGRPPTPLARLDQILEEGTQVAYDGIRNSIRVRAVGQPGRPFVVVSGFDPNHIVTAMVPK